MDDDFIIGRREEEKEEEDEEKRGVSPKILRIFFFDKQSMASMFLTC